MDGRKDRNGNDITTLVGRFALENKKAREDE